MFTEDGRELLDFTSGQMSAILGHAHPDIVATVREQVGRLDHLYSGMLSRPVARPRPAARGDAARRRWTKAHAPDHRGGGERGRAADGQARHRPARGRLLRPVLARDDPGAPPTPPTAPGAPGYGPAAPGNFALPVPDRFRPAIVDADGNLDWRRQLDLGFDLIDAQSVGSLAACLVEPILSSGGVVDLPPGYLAALRDKCHERGMLLILDEAQTGLCRTGDWYAFQRDGVVPDILTLSKTLGAGLPLAAVLTSAEIEQRAHERGFLFFTTHVNDPLPAAVGNTVLDVLVRDRLDVRARELGDRLRGGLDELAARHEVIGDVRGRGLLVGLELVGDERRARRRRPARCRRHPALRRARPAHEHRPAAGHGRDLPHRPAADRHRRRDRPGRGHPRHRPDRREGLSRRATSADRPRGPAVPG